VKLFLLSEILCLFYYVLRSPLMFLFGYYRFKERIISRICPFCNVDRAFLY